MKKFIKNLKVITVSTICLYLAYITGTGEILNYIPFADPMNELAFFSLTATTGIGSLFCISK